MVHAGPVFALTQIQGNLLEVLFSKYFVAKFLGEFVSVRMHAAPVFALARIQENILEDFLYIGGFVPGGMILPDKVFKMQTNPENQIYH